MCNNKINYFFGSKENDLKTEGHYNNAKFELLMKQHDLNGIFYLKQTHSNIVYTLKEPVQVSLFEHEGDAIITNLSNIAIGVATADCMPLCVIDYHNNVIGVIHAGWKGLSTHIISNTVSEMQKKFNADIKTMQFIIGPSAHVCCYEVQEDFLKYFNHRNEKHLFEKRDNKLFFNGLSCAIDEIFTLGAEKNQIDITAHQCTICNTQFCSYRRDNVFSGRQPSIVFLRDKT